MARPKSDDPTVAIPFRMKQSAAQWWERQAASEKLALPKLLRRILEEKADREQGVEYQPSGTAKPMKLPTGHRTGEVQPRFKKGGK